MKLINNLKPNFLKSSKKNKTQKTHKTPSIKSTSSSSSSSSSSSDLERVLRCLGPYPPSDDEILALGSMSIDDILTLGSSGIEPEAELRETFRVFDVDGDGKISAEELMGLFGMLGEEECGIEECRTMIERVDFDGDGFVCFEDFVRMMGMQR
ncbi:uncharacterized protein A4U43_C03F26450 [Asparagus officinalis]|uniref:EF-hand domain-containing protein n=1 Tax=Asparagus officinalis TaxID=4686 RepID=A0A5P1FD80_ASPOF|nr:probable calcium-binding protein CML35 [Asparagus officinalis]ONK76328.1 uncharacterized protein A4U43_C03F26450 [Asparagus officinalis]